MTKEEVLKQYNKLINKLVNKFDIPSPRYSREDLVSEAVTALLKATDSYDPTRGVAFMSYLYKSIFRELQRFIQNNSFSLKVPIQTQVTEYKTVGHINDLRQKATAVPIDTKVNGWNGEEYTLADIIPSGSIEPIDAMIGMERMQILHEEIEKLPEHEKFVIQSKYFDTMTTGEIAEAARISKPTVYILEKKGMNRLRQRMIGRLGSD